MAFWMTGCLYGASSVMLGAFGAHGLKSRISDPARIANWGTAAHYQLIHSVALLVAEQAAPKNIWAKSLFTVGMTMFSGSIYCLVLDPQRFKFMGPVTPLGGVCLIGGWVALAFVELLPTISPRDLVSAPQPGAPTTFSTVSTASLTSNASMVLDMTMQLL
ncbi:hypothetical protein D0865_10984 [Hortaea werneckii]|uniref:DUF423 domain-containing protein n=1 Tax=Hortaea werneckii TaxID=91943 RepID=A0A3M7BW56_HORWE|nr:hypothetical protein D0865_10984 [Hortaea werneckii]